MFQFAFPSFFSLTHLCFWVKFWGRGESRGEGGRDDDDDDGRSSINSIVAMWLYLRTLHSTSTLYLLWPLWHWYMCMFSFFISRHKWQRFVPLNQVVHGSEFESQLVIRYEIINNSCWERILTLCALMVSDKNLSLLLAG